MPLLPLTGVYSPGATRTVIDKLKIGMSPVCVALYGDSTANGGNEWFVGAMDWLGSQFPAYTVTHTAWNHTLQMWDPANAEYAVSYLRQTGTAGDAYISGTWSASDYLTTPDAALLQITGNLDVRAKIMPTSWTAGVTNLTITSKFGVAGNRSWRLYIGSGGSKLVFNASQDGTALVTATSAPNLFSVFADGTAGWVRATYTAATSKVDFYTSPDGITWTAFGAQQTLTGITALFASTQPAEIGARGQGTEPFAGRIYYVEWRQGIGSAGIPRLVVDMDAAVGTGADADQFIGHGTFTDTLGLVWTKEGTGTDLLVTGSPGLFCFNGSTPSQNVSYSTDVSRGPKQRTIMTPDVAFISYSHNESTTIDGYRTSYKALTDACISAWPDVGVVVCAQNPRTSPSTNVRPHAIRTQALIALANAQRYGLVDAFTAFTTDRRGVAALVESSDGIHPNQDGSDLWRDVAKDLFRPWIGTPNYSSVPGSIIGSIG